MEQQICSSCGGAKTKLVTVVSVGADGKPIQRLQQQPCPGCGGSGVRR
ncbi:hypothetical protein [Actinacidiphila glaucinigra]